VAYGTSVCQRCVLASSTNKRKDKKLATTFISDNITEGKDDMGIGVFTVEKYGLTIEYPVKLPTDAPLTLKASVFKQIASGSTNAFTEFTINPDQTFVQDNDYQTLAPDALAAVVITMPVNSDVYEIASADYDAVVAMLT